MHPSSGANIWGKKTCTLESGGGARHPMDTKGTPAQKVNLRTNPLLDSLQKLPLLKPPAKKKMGKN